MAHLLNSTSDAAPQRGSKFDFIIEAKYPVITGFLSQSVGIMQK